MIFLKVISDILCGVLNALGGWKFLWMRRYIMPVIIGLTVSLVTRVWWLGFLVLPVIGTLTLGYFSASNWGRALWLFLQSIAISLPLFIFNHIEWYFYIPYILGAGILGGFYKNWEQVYGDFVTGFYLGSIIYFIH